MEILPTQGICKEASLATRLHTNKIEVFWLSLKRWMPRSGIYNLSQNINIYLWLRTNRINKVYTFWALVNLVRENNSTDLMNSAHDIIPDVEGCDNNKKKMLWIVNQTRTARTLPVKDLTIHAYFAILTSSTRRRLLSTWKSVQEQTQNVRCWNWPVLTASKPLKHMTKLGSTLKFTSWDRLETCIRGLAR